MNKVKNNKSGFTLVEIMIVVAIIALLSVIAVPSFQKARENSMTSACVNNLRLIDGAVDQYALDNGNTQPTLANLTPDYIKRAPICPVGNLGTYTVATVAGAVAVCPNALPDHVIQ